MRQYVIEVLDTAEQITPEKVSEELKAMLLHLVGRDKPHNYYHAVCSTCEKIRKFEQANRCHEQSEEK